VVVGDPRRLSKTPVPLKPNRGITNPQDTLKIKINAVPLHFYHMSLTTISINPSKPISPAHKTGVGCDGPKITLREERGIIIMSKGNKREMSSPGLV
jgi:hypothetical protein